MGRFTFSADESSRNIALLFENVRSIASTDLSKEFGPNKLTFGLMFSIFFRSVFVRHPATINGLLSIVNCLMR